MKLAMESSSAFTSCEGGRGGQTEVAMNTVDPENLMGSLED